MQMNSPHGILTSLIFVLALLSGTGLFAQDRVPDRGPRPTQPFSSTEFDSVNLINGNVLVAIPLASLPKGRGASPDFPISLGYNSKLWDAKREERNDGFPDGSGSTKYHAEFAIPSPNGGWSVRIGYRLLVRVRSETETAVPCNGSTEMLKNVYAFKTSILFPDGTEHDLHPHGFTDMFGDGYFNVTPNGLVSQWSYSNLGYGQGSCRLTTSQVTGGEMTYYSSDGTHIRFVITRTGDPTSLGRENPWTMHLPDGTVVEKTPADDPTVLQRITDRNGNRTRLLRRPIDGVESTVVEDDLGRQTVHQSTPSGDRVIQKGFRGEALETSIEWKTVYIRRVYNAADVSAFNAPPQIRAYELFQPMQVLRKVTLPRQLGGGSFEFFYNASDEPPSASTETVGWGELKSMKVPSGARVEYAYQLDQAPAVQVSFDIVGNPVAERRFTFLEEDDGAASERTEVTRYAIGPDSAAVTHPDGSSSLTRFVSTQSGACDSGTPLSVREPDGSVTESLWTDFCLNRYQKAEFRTVPDANGNASLTAVTEFLRDRNGNLLEKKEYDWIPYSTVPRAGGRVTGLPPGLTLLRRTVNTYHNPTPPADGRLEVSSARLRIAVASSRIEDGAGAVSSREEYLYDDASGRGNPVLIRRWDNSRGGLRQREAGEFLLDSSNSVEVSRNYDRFGNVVLATDPRGTSTETTYGQVNGIEGLYPTRTIEAVNTSVARTEEFEYDFDTGLRTRALLRGNLNSENVETLTGYDAAGRVVSRTTGAGTPYESRTRTEYHHVQRAVVTRTDVESPGDGRRVSVEHFDQRGRIRLIRSLDRPSVQNPLDESAGVKVQYRYRTSSGLTDELVSNPYTTASANSSKAERSMGWKRTRKSQGGRVAETERFTGAEPPAPWGGNVNSTGRSTVRVDSKSVLSTDEAGAATVSSTDPLGNVTDVFEVTASGDAGVPFAGTVLRAFRTSYSHDLFGNVRRVMQGSQTRAFEYDSLSRLRSASHPETGTSRFWYDPAGSMTAAVDARGIETRFIYDALGRILRRSPSSTGATAGYAPQSAVSYSYDESSVPFSKGRLTRVNTDTSDTRIRALDPEGRILALEQVTASVSYPSRYRFNLAGDLSEETYPSGRVVRTIVDEDGDAVLVEGARAGSRQPHAYASGIARDAAGNMTAVRYGNGFWETADFNAKMALAAVRLGTVKGSANVQGLVNLFRASDNGNVAGQRISVPGIAMREQTFGYDELNRLTTASELSAGVVAWRQGFAYDRHGNRTFNEMLTSTLPKSCRSGLGTSVCPGDRKRLNPAISSSTNRYVADQDGDGVADYVHDAAGNVLGDAFGNGFLYDAENRQRLVKDRFGNLLAEYHYDGFGRRVKKTSYLNNVPDETTVFVYSPDGRTLAEYSDRAERHLAGRTVFMTSDQIGSPRALTDQFRRVVGRRDYLPFGEELPDSARGKDGVRKKFTGYERDSETGLDHAGVRRYSPFHGRFLSPDPALESMVALSPQSWNRYAYVLNNPLRFMDPQGELWTLNTGGDRVRRPYRWVDFCSSGQTCWTAVALGTASGVRVYGSRDAFDISHYSANEHGQIDTGDLLSHHDSNYVSVAMRQGLPEPFLSIRAAEVVFNAGLAYGSRFAGDEKLVFTNGNGPDGKPCVYANGKSCHSGHRGSDVDLRYMDSSGRALTGVGASAAADPTRTRFLVEQFKGMGLPEAFSGHPDRHGTLPASEGNRRIHRNHLHIGIFDTASVPSSDEKARRGKR